MAKVRWDPPGPGGLCINTWGEGIFKFYFIEIKMGLEESGTAHISISVITHKQFINGRNLLNAFSQHQSCTVYNPSCVNVI